MATDAKIDELIKSLEKLVKTLSKSTGSGSSTGGTGGATRSSLDLGSDADIAAQRSRLAANIEDLEKESKALQDRIDVGRELSDVEERRLKQLAEEKAAIQAVSDSLDKSTEEITRAKIAYEDLTEAQHKSNQEFAA